MPDSLLPRAGSAQVHVVHEGYVREADGQQHVGGTVTLIIDGDAVIVVDPGMVSSRDELLAMIAQHGVQPGFTITGRSTTATCGSAGRRRGRSSARRSP
jgi:glyoxylase-like metal-dependent hydrolase (beta-lactamase superfamily II)